MPASFSFVRFIVRIFRNTYSEVKPIVKANRALIFWLIIISIILGSLPTLKSALESRFLSEANNMIGNNGNEKPKTIHQIFFHKFPERGGGEDMVDRINSWLTSNNYLWCILLIYAAATTLTFVFEYLAERIKRGLEKNVFINVRTKALEKALLLNPSDMPKELNATGSFGNAIQIGTGNITDVYSFFADAAQYFFLFVTSIYVLMNISPMFGIFFLLILATQVIISIIRANVLKGQRNDQDKQRNHLLAVSNEIIDKKEIILAFEQEENFIERIKSMTTKFMELTRVLAIRDFLYANTSKLISDIERFVIPLLALIFFVKYHLTSINDLGGIIFLLNLYIRLSVPVLNLMRQYDSVSEKEAISNAFLSLLEMNNNKVRLAKKAELSGDYPAIRFAEVSFSYYDADKKIRKVFSELSFDIPDHQTTVILGPSGCGKSTIAKLILSFYKPDSGNLLMMGQDFNTYTDREIREFSSYLSQRDFIVEDTVRDNLNWGVNGEIIEDARLIDALRQVKLEKADILDLFAKDLSGGEQQRLSLARIILDKSPILILDEPLTGLDVYTMADIYPAFIDVLKSQNRAVVLISHKLSFINCADNVIMLTGDGKIAEQGPPKDLIKNPGSALSVLFDAALKELSLADKLIDTVKSKL